MALVRVSETRIAAATLAYGNAVWEEPTTFRR